MSDSQPKIGTIGWTDLTVQDASEVRSFYEAVVGWKSESVEMGDYSDFCMKPTDSDPAVAGICHARGMNADLPPQWLIYIVVENLQQSVERCREHGGEILHERAGGQGSGGFAVIRDPAGAVAGLYQPK